MRLDPISLTAVLGLLAMPVQADFDLWLRQICSICLGGPGCKPECGWNWVSAPAYGDYRCEGRVQFIGGLGQNPCEKQMEMDGKYVQIAGCKHDDYGADGSRYGLGVRFDGGATTIGDCFTWLGGKSGKTCSGLPEYWMSRVTCKIHNAFGRP